MTTTVEANAAVESHALMCSRLVQVNSPCRCPNQFEARAFTLAELLVVIAIIAVLAGLFFPVLSKARETGKGTVCLSNLRQAGVALQLYAQDNNNRLPFMRDRPLTNSSNDQLSSTNLPGPEIVLSNYLVNVVVLKCPSDKEIFRRTLSSYSWNSLLNGQNADHLEMFGISFNPHQVPLMFDKEKFHAARGQAKAQNFLFADGHLKNLLVLEGGTLNLP